jgi:hypothetical protein
MPISRILLLILLLPLYTSAQTVHLEDDKIVYKGKEKLGNLDKGEIYKRINSAIAKYISVVDHKLDSSYEEGNVTARGKLKLSSTYSLLRSLQFTIKFTITDEEYKYKIDSVYIDQHERGGKTTEIPSEELVKLMDVSGPVAADTEKKLNEIDMEFQKIIALIKREVQGK